jgi:hypothetical protein
MRFPAAEDKRDDPDIRYVWSPDPYPVLIGAGILVSMYLIPVFPVPGGRPGVVITFAQFVTSCGTPPLSCTVIQSITFWIGWGISVCLIIYGLLSKKPDLSFERT